MDGSFAVIAFPIKICNMFTLDFIREIHAAGGNVRLIKPEGPDHFAMIATCQDEKSRDSYLYCYDYNTPL